jgi:hypothetical protein
VYYVALWAGKKHLSCRPVCVQKFPTTAILKQPSGVPWLRQLVAGLSPQRPTFNPRLVLLGFLVGKVTLEQVFLQALWFSHFTIIQPFHHPFIPSVVNSSVTHTIESSHLIMSLCDTFKETILQNSWSSKYLNCWKVVAFLVHHSINQYDSYSSATAACQVWIRKQSLLVCQLSSTYNCWWCSLFKNVEHWQSIHSVLSFHFAIWWAAFYTEAYYFSPVCRSYHICFIALSRVKQFK